MNLHDVAEQAYKKGYADGKRDAVVHGEWLNTKFTTELLCSNCFELSYMPITKMGRKPYNYCPNCGAKMDTEE